MCKETIINLLLDNIALPCDIAKELIDKADTNKDGSITLREFYNIYKRWRNGE